MAEQKGKKLRQPKLVEDQLKPVTDAEEWLMILETAAYEESAIENYWAKGLQFAEMDWHGLAIHNVLFTSCRFSGCHFEKASFRQTVLRNCDISNCNFGDSYWDCCTLEEIKGPGLLWQESSLHHILFRHCQMRYANLTRAGLEFVQFEQCGLQEASFSACKFKNCQWSESDLSKGDFFRAPLCNIDLSDCEISGIMVSDDFHELKGVTVNSFQAVELSKLLGLVVK